MAASSVERIHAMYQNQNPKNQKLCRKANSQQINKKVESDEVLKKL